jgi:broad-specificity NMP kinase
LRSTKTPKISPAPFLTIAMPRPPNLLITGTPGTGKSSLAELVTHDFDGLTHLNVSEIIKERKLADKFNQEWQSWEFDDDKAPPSSRPFLVKTVF